MSKSSEDNKVSKEIPSFLTKIYEIVDSAVDDLVHWSPDGKSFLVRDPKRLAKEILPQFFKTTNFSSFVRQLNFYGFRKINFDERQSKKSSLQGEAKYWEFKHANFIRGRQDLLKNIKRKTYAENNTASKEELESLRNEVELRNIEIESAESRMQHLENICNDLQSEMNELRRNYSQQIKDFHIFRNSMNTMVDIPFNNNNNDSKADDLHPLNLNPLSSSMDSICWKFDDPDEKKESFNLDNMVLDLNDSLFMSDNEGSSLLDSNPINDLLLSNDFDLLTPEPLNSLPTKDETIESKIIEDELPIKPTEEPLVALEALLNSQTPLQQKEFLVKLVNTINEMFPHVSKMFERTDSKPLKRDKTPQKIKVNARKTSLSPPSPLIENAMPTLLRTNSNSNVLQTQQEAVNMMTFLLPSIQMALLHVVTASLNQIKVK